MIIAVSLRRRGPPRAAGELYIGSVNRQSHTDRKFRLTGLRRSTAFFQSAAAPTTAGIHSIFDIANATPAYRQRKLRVCHAARGCSDRRSPIGEHTYVDIRSNADLSTMRIRGRRRDDPPIQRERYFSNFRILSHRMRHFSRHIPSRFGVSALFLHSRRICINVSVTS